jgi:transketolase N-terminal domain/subunit
MHRQAQQNSLFASLDFLLIFEVFDRNVQQPDSPERAGDQTVILSKQLASPASCCTEREREAFPREGLTTSATRTIEAQPPDGKFQPLFS